MSPPVAIAPQPEEQLAILSMKNGINGERAFDVAENYEGNYRFAPIEEAQVSRAMIKRSVLQSRVVVFMLANVSRKLLQHHVRASRLRRCDHRRWECRSLMRVPLGQVSSGLEDHDS